MTMSMCRAVLVLLLGALAGSACTTTSTFRVEPANTVVVSPRSPPLPAEAPKDADTRAAQEQDRRAAQEALASLGLKPATVRDAHLIVDEHDVGRIDGTGVDVPIPAGVAPVQWRVVEGGQVIGEGSLERDQVAWGVVLGAGAAAACCIPTMAATGFCLANPALLASPLACAAGNPGVCITACQAPGWSSIPFTGIGAALGATPLFFGLLGAHLPPEVTLTVAPPAPTPTQPTAPTAPTTTPTEPTTPSPAAASVAPPQTALRAEGMWF
jgi:hypothetical protein